MFKSETRKKVKSDDFWKNRIAAKRHQGCRPGFCSSREEELTTDHEGREKEISFAR